MFAFSHGNQYHLKYNKTDACFEPSQKATAECLQELIETFYTKSFTKYCPDFPQVLAEARCKGCPWDRLDPKKIKPIIDRENWDAAKETGLFHTPLPSCDISRHVYPFKTYQGVARYVARWAIIGGIPVLFSTGAIVQYTSDPKGLIQPAFSGWEMSEWMFMGAVWISFNVGVIILSISEEYYHYCDTAASNIALIIARDLSYFVLIYYSLRRCRLLSFPQGFQSLNSREEAQPTNDTGTSWHTFVKDSEEKGWKQYFRSQKAVAWCLVYGSSFAVLLICLIDASGLIKLSNREGLSLCFIPVVNIWTKVIGISKLTLEPLVYVVYSFGASQRSKVVYHIRYAVLAVITVYCITAMFLMSLDNVYQPYDEGFLFRRVPIWSVTSEVTEISHVLVVCMLGLLEPLRYGSMYTLQR